MPRLRLPATPTLREHVDLLVVGAGMTGLRLAQLLAEKNVQVAVVEALPRYRHNPI